MNKHLIVTLTALFALAAPTFAAEQKGAKPSEKSAPTKAEGAGTPAEKKAMDATKPLPFQGKVAAVDAAAKTFTTKSKEGKESVFLVTDKTKIEKADGSAAAFSDIKVDEIVRGRRMQSGEKWEAVKVIIGAKPKKEAAAATGAATPGPKK